MSTELDAATDRLNQELRSAEEWIRKLNYSVTAQVQLKLDADNVYHYLAWGRVNDSAFGLQYRTRHADDEYPEVRPLLSAPREYRVMASFELNTLLLALNDVTRKQTHDVVAAIDAVVRFRDATRRHVELEAK